MWTFRSPRERRLPGGIWLLAGLSAVCARSPADLTVTNLHSGDVLRYPVALLRGAADGATEVAVANAGNPRPDGRNRAPVVEGRYVVLVELRPGPNRLELTAGEERTELSVSYQPMATPYAVNVVYVTGQEGDTQYITPRADDPQDYRDRLSTAAKLMQTFTAETLNDQGFGRQTFNLEVDDEGKVAVHTLAYPLPAEELRKREAGDLYGLIYDWLDKQLPTSCSKNLVVMGFTGYDREKRELRAHAALGGGGMALFGSPNLFTWPSSIRDVAQVFADATPIDPATTPDDSAGRSVIWGAAATTLGAVLHEMGHTWGLPHSNDPFCIMSRGFDHFNRYFSPIEPSMSHRQEPYLFPPGEMARFGEYFAAQLSCSRWFQPDGGEFRDEPGPKITVDLGSNEFVFEAPQGIALWGARNSEEGEGEKVVYRLLGDEEQTAVRVSREALWAKPGGKGKIELLVIDRQGNAFGIRDSELRDPEEFLHRWRLAAEPKPWTTAPKPPELAQEQVDGIIADLSQQPLGDYRHPEGNRHYSLDLNEAYGPHNDVVAYALTTVQADAERTTTLFAGGDDGFRIWLNGKLVLDVPGLLADPPDSHSATVTLTPGANTLLVESTQGPGDWGFSVRLGEP
jgi:Putative peptidase family